MNGFDPWFRIRNNLVFIDSMKAMDLHTREFIANCNNYSNCSNNSNNSNNSNKNTDNDNVIPKDCYNLLCSKNNQLSSTIYNIQILLDELQDSQRKISSILNSSSVSSNSKTTRKNCNPNTSDSKNNKKKLDSILLFLRKLLHSTFYSSKNSKHISSISNNHEKNPNNRDSSIEVKENLLAIYSRINEIISLIEQSCYGNSFPRTSELIPSQDIFSSTSNENILTRNSCDFENNPETVSSLSPHLSDITFLSSPSSSSSLSTFVGQDTIKNNSTSIYYSPYAAFSASSFNSTTNEPSRVPSAYFTPIKDYSLDENTIINSIYLDSPLTIKLNSTVNKIQERNSIKKKNLKKSKFPLRPERNNSVMNSVSSSSSFSSTSSSMSFLSQSTSISSTPSNGMFLELPKLVKSCYKKGKQKDYNLLQTSTNVSEQTITNRHTSTSSSEIQTFPIDVINEFDSEYTNSQNNSFNYNQTNTIDSHNNDNSTRLSSYLKSPANRDPSICSLKSLDTIQYSLDDLNCLFSRSINQISTSEIFSSQ